KGDIVLGGNIMTSSSTTDVGGVSTKTSSSMIGPDVAYFIDDNFALELGLGIGSSKTGSTTRATSNVAVGARYYFLNLGERFKTYTSFGLNFGSDDNGGNGAEKTSTLGFGAGLGMNYFLTSKVAINFGLGNVISYDSSKTGNSSTSSMNINLNEFNNFFTKPTFGVSYRF
ncbi:outer membrane beta-barrel protein, partial [Flavobacterium sp.]|uniref:outer membrane beta-barrel protein n=1 Tax=Flavobacterium sp. TaxID=239 RepID=UPI0038D14FA5